MTKWFPFLRGSEFEVSPERQGYALRARKGCLGRSNSPMEGTWVMLAGEDEGWEGWDPVLLTFDLDLYALPKSLDFISQAPRSQ